MGHQFGSRLKQLRTERHLRQRDLEKVLNLRPGAASQYERGLREPGFDLLLTIANYFAVSVDYLLGRAGAESPGWHGRSAAVKPLAPPSNLDRLTRALARGLPVPVLLGDQVGFVVRLDDTIFGPVALVDVPEAMGLRLCRCDPDEVTILNPGGSLREG